MSAIKKLYDAISAKITANVTEIKTIDIWNNQLSNDKLEYPINFPAVFIEIGEVTWLQQQHPGRIGTGVDGIAEQKGDCIVTIHSVFTSLKQYDESFADISEIVHKIYRFLNKLEKGSQTDGYFSPLIRVASRLSGDHDNVIDWQTDFKTMIEEQPILEEDRLSAPGGTIATTLTVQFE